MEENKNIESTPVETAVENPEYGPNKQAFRDRFAERYPDVDMDDEEAYFGALNDADAENDRKSQRLEQLENDQRAFGEAMDADPALAELFLEMTKKGGKPIDLLIDRYAQAFSDLVNDPDNDEYRKALADKIAADLEESHDLRALEEETESNIEPSLDALAEVSEEMGLSPEETAEAFKKFAEITNDLVVGKVSADTWRLFINGVNHDASLEEARIEGETAGRNAKIGEKLRKETPSALNMGSSGGSTPTTPRGDTSSLYTSVWDEEE